MNSPIDNAATEIARLVLTGLPSPAEPLRPQVREILERHFAESPADLQEPIDIPEPFCFGDSYELRAYASGYRKGRVDRAAFDAEKGGG